MKARKLSHLDVIKPGTFLSATPHPDCVNWDCERLGGHHYKCAGYFANRPEYCSTPAQPARKK